MYFYSREQRAKRTCKHVRLAVLYAGGTRLAPISQICAFPLHSLYKNAAPA